MIGLAETFACPHCGVTENVRGASGEVWCRACRKDITSALLNPHLVKRPQEKVDSPPTLGERQEFLDKLSDLNRETDIYEICDIFSPVIKRDLPTTAITFLALVLTYTDRNQVVICYKADSSTGKSYIPLEIVSLFPDQGRDVLKLAGASPTSFIHEANAEPVYEEGIDDKGRPVKRLKHLVVDLEREILIFKDQPDYRLLAKLRSFLSKDEREAVFKFTDRAKSGKHRTKTVILRGHPTVLYCSAKPRAKTRSCSTIMSRGGHWLNE